MGSSIGLLLLLMGAGAFTFSSVEVGEVVSLYPAKEASYAASLAMTGFWMGIFLLFLANMVTINMKR